jgi:uncharacterized RDD family membrane protein YckC
MKQQTTTPSTLQGQYAGFISRFLAYMVDLLLVIAAITILGVTVDIILRFFRLDDLIDQLLASNNFAEDLLRLLAFLGSVAFISFSYFVVIWTVTAGQSVGKVLFGVRIVPMDGSKMTFWRSILRYFAFLFSAAILFIGLLWVLVSDSRQGWHDKFAKTCVIYDWPARENDGVIGTLHSRMSYLRSTRHRLRTRKIEQSTSNRDSGTEAAVEEIESAQG